MATETIFVSVIPGTAELTFEDNSGNSGKEITTGADRGDKVKWKTRTSGLVITGIPMKNPSGDTIWGDAPSAKNSGEWEGSISETAPDGTVGYSVQYTINGGAQLEQDPDIRIPKQ
jgi:uncharacterized protein (DUF2147 family)